MNETQRRPLHARQPNPRRGPARKRATRIRRACRVLLGLALLTQFLPFAFAPRAARAQAEIVLDGTAAQPAAVATVSFSDLAAQSAAPADKFAAAEAASDAQVEPPPNPPEPEAAPQSKSVAGATHGGTSKSVGRAAKSGATADAPADGGKVMQFTASAVGDTSRPPATEFHAQSDAGTHAPPNAAGAPGFEYVISMHGSNYVVQEKASGGTVSSVPVQTFWAATGATGVFNPRVVFDRASNRWLLAAVSNARSGSSSVLLAVSQWPGDANNFRLYRFDADPTDTLWADYPSLGFNKNWVALSVNLHNVSNDSFNQGMVLALSFPHLQMGTVAASEFRNISNVNGGITMQPAVTYSETEEIEYLVSHLGSAAGTYRVSWLAGALTDPSLFIGAQKSNGLGGWTQPGGETLPQAGGARKIESQDSRVQKVVYRNGSIYFCQTVGLPAGRTAATIDRTAAQWARVDAGGDFQEGGRVEDPAATPTNGGKWYAYPSLSVNRLGDVLMGFTQFSSAQFASAGYAYRTYDDPAGTMRLPYVYKAGEGYYERLSPANRNLWGLHSSAQTDVNHLDIWTLQEYAAPPAGTGSTSGRWRTHWAKVTPPSADRIAFVSNRDGNDEIYTMEADGSHVRRLTNNPAQDTEPSWSPDRTRIAFTRLGANGRQIFTMNADGSNQQFLTQGMEPAWSPWGDYIAFVRGVDIWTHLVGDGEEINVTNNWGENSYYRPWIGYYGCGDRKPSWSPDGETILFYGWIEDSRYIFTIPYWGGERTLIQSDDGIGEPVWSPDGSKIAYWNYGRICTMNPDGEDSVCTDGFSQDYSPAWSPDGSKITFYTNRTGNYEVFSMNSDFTGSVNLTNSPASHEWSPGW